MTGGERFRTILVAYVVVLLDHTLIPHLYWRGMSWQLVVVGLTGWSFRGQAEAALIYAVAAGIWSNFLYGEPAWWPLVYVAGVGLILVWRRFLGSGWAIQLLSLLVWVGATRGLGLVPGSAGGGEILSAALLHWGGLILLTAGLRIARPRRGSEGYLTG